MHDHDDEKRDKDTNGENGETKPHPHILDAQGHEFPDSSAAPETKSKKPKNYLKKLLDEKPDRHIELALTFAISFFALAQLIVTCSNNISTSQQSERLLESANRIDDAADSFSASASHINGGIGQAVHKLNMQARELAESASQTSRLATATETANAHSIDFDRPWIGVTQLIQNFPSGNEPPKVTVSVINSGHRPAKITLMETVTGAYPFFPNPPPFVMEQGIDPSITLLVPNLSTSHDASVNSEAVDARHILAYSSGALTFFVFTNVEYEDVVTRNTHWVHACVRYIPQKKSTKAGFYQCSQYNEVDQD